MNAFWVATHNSATTISEMYNRELKNAGFRYRVIVLIISSTGLSIAG
jgi:hypothetical protein